MTLEADEESTEFPNRLFVLCAPHTLFSTPLALPKSRVRGGAASCGAACVVRGVGAGGGGGGRRGRCAAVTRGDLATK